MSEATTMPRRRTWWLLGAALAARLVLQGWDSGLLSPHPDERQVAFVAERLVGWFSDPAFYAYGSLHFHLVRMMTALGGLPPAYAGFLVGGRFLSLVASTVGLLVAWSLARRAWGERSAELFLLIGAVVPLDLQLSHFATVEADHALWVMVALAAAHAAAWRGRPLAALVAGAAWGASLAVKVASLPLAAALAVAAVASAQRHGPRVAARQTATAVAAAVVAFWLGQPSAFVGLAAPLWPLALSVGAAGLLALPAASPGRARASAIAAAVAAAAAVASAWLTPLNPAYLRGLAEQIAMVSGRADLPYTRVYHPTVAFLYSARELFLWGLGPTLAIAAVLATGAALWRLGRRLVARRRWHDPGPLLLALLLAWVVPVALRLATLEVKFLRYWQPLVLPLALLAAWWLARLAPPWRWRVVAAAGVGSLLVATAYLWAFAAPHPHQQAAHWLDPLLDAGSVVAFEHWDEGLSLPALAGPSRAVTLASYDLPDDDTKVRRWAETLAEAEWVVLTSSRVRRTVAANPHRFARTGRLYEELLAGRVGFAVAAVAERGPRFLGLRLPVQRADESFVNYDFPRVVILHRVAPTDVDALVTASADGLAGDFAALERALADAPRLPFAPTARAQVGAGVAWLLVLALVTLSWWILLEPLGRRCADAGLGLAAVTGWVAVAWTVWLGSELGLWRVGRGTCSWLVVATVAAAALTAWRRWPSLAATLARRRRGMMMTTAAAGAALLVFAAARLLNPAVYWGEKPMDATFLNAFLRAPAWPPGEPWMAGERLNYYYFGEVLAAVPILAADVPQRLGYNLMAATVPALATAALASLGLTLAAGRRRGLGLVLLGLVMATGNLAWPFLLDLASAGRWFDLWWATSRVIPGFAIDEYPLWTSLFADLHGHFLALPVVVAAYAWAFVATRGEGRRWPLAAAMCGLCAGVLAATNPWDLLLFTATLGLVSVSVARRPLASLGRLTVAAVVAVAVAAPFLVELAAWVAAGVGGRVVFLNGADFAPVWAILRHLGLFLVPLALLAATRIGHDAWVALPLAVAGVSGGLAFGSQAAAVGLAAAGLFVTAIGRERGGRERLAWTLAALAMLAVAVCERVTLVDRMNTLFKLYNGIWLLLATALTLALITSHGWRRRLLLASWLPLQAVALVNLPLGVAQGAVQPRISSPRPTLDGQAFLARHDPQTAFLATALNGLGRPGDVVLEAAGDPYREFTRVAMHTGLATVVGWEHHLYQRGQARAAITARFANVGAFYIGHDPELRRHLLDVYGVDWVVLADVERRAYDRAGDAGLGAVPGLSLVASHRGASLYRVLPSPTADDPPPGRRQRRNG